MRPRFTWKLRRRALELGERTVVMGVVNVTPDSFSDGGLYFDPAKAVDHGVQLLGEGADILDVGGESTRPGARVAEAGLPAADELRRVIPVIEGILKQAPDAVVSVDTYKARVAREAAAAGAEIVNDVSALQWDPAMGHTCAELQCGVVLMHMRGRPEEWRELPSIRGSELMTMISTDLAKAVAAARSAGVARDRIVIDPGFGFGKNFDENYPVLAHLNQLHKLGYPVLAGTSRKSFIARTVARGAEPPPPDRRVYGTLATVTAAVLAGAHIVRVHDVMAAVEAAAVADAILNARGS